MKSYKTELKPTEAQKQKLIQYFGICRWIYNQYLAENKAHYDSTGKFLSAFAYSKKLNHDPNTPDWVKLAPSVCIQQSMSHGERAFKSFFKRNAKFPKFKKKGKCLDSCKFTQSIKVDRHRIRIPKIGWIRLKEFGYIPKEVSSCSITMKAGRFYVSCVHKSYNLLPPMNSNNGIGIDLGVSKLATLSNGTIFEGINKSSSVKRLEYKLKREQRQLSKKFRTNKSDTKRNIEKQKLKVQKLYIKLSNIRTDYINKVIDSIIKQKPSFVTIEDLNITQMMKNRYLAKLISQQRFFELRTKLENKCKDHGIELRVVSRTYPSSKTCSNCGNIKNLKLSDRIYKCCCGLEIDRDINASLNLLNANEYKVR